MTLRHDRIEAGRRRLGPALTIMAHHYQADEVVRHADLRGDTLQLARRVQSVDSEHIIFCGVYFMAEAAALLARPGQKVHLPEPSAECSMALMSTAEAAKTVLARLTATGRTVIPLVYGNSTLGVKAVAGAHGGAVCTSANARTMLRWALDQGDAVLFLPDRHLGWNTADALDLPLEDRKVLSLQDDGQGEEEKARLYLWPGFCSIHTRFTTRQISRLRTENPGALVVAHPECRPEVVAGADAVGSTAFIIRYVAEAPAGAVCIVGTEINLVERLAEEHRGRVTVLPLVESACTHMAQTTEECLESCLAAVAEGREDFVIRAPEENREPAKLALERMLSVAG
ncbi:MAG: quinolinate synthase NadA [Desulfovibrio sp.]|jgi:quinolinate synthase|nr:quinolinate synthase NadA [Desulfovibrio sp.]